MGISFSAVIAMLAAQQKEGQSIQQQLARASLKYSILQTLKNEGNCLCQFNDLPDTPYKIDTTKVTTQNGDEIDLNEFRSGCDIIDNILVEKGEKIKGGAGLQAQSVKVSNIKETGTANEYLGQLTVVYEPASTVRTIRPLTVPLRFSVAPGGEEPTEATIISCGVDIDVSSEVADMEARIKENEETIAELRNEVLSIQPDNEANHPANTCPGIGITIRTSYQSRSVGNNRGTFSRRCFKITKRCRYFHWGRDFSNAGAAQDFVIVSVSNVKVCRDSWLPLSTLTESTVGYRGGKLSGRILQTEAMV